MSGAIGVVGFASIGGILFGLDQGNWGGAIEKKPFKAIFCSLPSDPHSLPDAWEMLGSTNYSCTGDPGTTLPADYNTFLQWGSALLQLGAALGALIIAPPLAGKLGRRETMFSGALITCCGVAPCVFLKTHIPFLAARFVAGLGVGQITYALPIFISEVAPTQIRGILGSMMQLTVVCGVLFASCLNLIPTFPYYFAFSLPIYPAAIVALGIFFFPMSPRFALLKYQVRQQPEEGIKRAKDSLRRLRGSEVAADKELLELQHAMASEPEESPWSTLCSDPSIRKRVLVANLLQWGQQFTGVNAILSYGPTIFHSAGVPGDPLVWAAIVNFFMLASTIATMFVIDVWGRKILLLGGGIIMSLSMGTAALLAKLINDNPDSPNNPTLGLGLVVAVCIYAIGFGPWGAVPWVYPSEIFPMDVKEKAMSTSVTSQWGANFLIAFLVVWQVNAIQAWGTLAFYAVCCSLVVVYVAFCVPEIKGVRMEDMESIFGARTQPLVA